MVAGEVTMVAPASAGTVVTRMLQGMRTPGGGTRTQACAMQVTPRTRRAILVMAGTVVALALALAGILEEQEGGGVEQDAVQREMIEMLTPPVVHPC
jgi:hypothetical protein